MTPKACKYCSFIGYRFSDEDCPDRPRWLRAWQWIKRQLRALAA